MNWRAALDRIFGMDLRSIAALRIGMALYILWDLADRALALEAHYTDMGVLNRVALAEYHKNDNWWWKEFDITWPNALSLHSLRGDTAWEVFLFIVAALFAIGLLVGYKTRFMAFVSWVLLLSLQNRNPLVLHGGDQMIRVMAFWAQLLPLGACWSIDGLCAQYRAHNLPVPKRTATLGTAGFLWQVCLVYFFTAYLKSGKEWRWNGTALYFALSIDLYGTYLGQFLRRFPDLCRLLTYGSLALEALGPLLLFVPLWKVRIACVALFWAFHMLGIGLFMDVGPLSWTSALLWLPLLPGEFWDGAAALWGRWKRLPFHGTVERLLSRLRSWRDARLARRIAARCPLPDIQISLPAQLLAAACVWFITVWNLARTPTWINWTAAFTRLDQEWGMFAPFPMKEDGWYAMPAQNRAGREFDLFTEKRVAWVKPAIAGRMFATERWRKYLMNLWSESNRHHWDSFARYYCHRSQKYDPASERLKSFHIYYMLERTPEPGGPPPVIQKVGLWRHYCDPADAPDELKKQHGIAYRER